MGLWETSCWGRTRPLANDMSSNHALQNDSIHRGCNGQRCDERRGARARAAASGKRFIDLHSFQAPDSPDHTPSPTAHCPPWPLAQHIGWSTAATTHQAEGLPLPVPRRKEVEKAMAGAEFLGRKNSPGWNFLGKDPVVSHMVILLMILRFVS